MKRLIVLCLAMSSASADVTGLLTPPGSAIPFSASSYGAKCDGVTDDTTAIQATITGGSGTSVTAWLDETVQV